MSSEGDLFSRVICGTRISLSVGLFAVTVGMLVGTIMGLLAGYYGGIVDSIIMRICDVLLAFRDLSWQLPLWPSWEADCITW